MQQFTGKGCRDRGRCTFRILATLWLGLLVGLSDVAAEEADTRPTLTFGVVPQQAISKLAQLWKPLLAEVSARSGVELRFVSTRDIPDFEEQLAQGRYDLAYMNPYHYIHVHEEPGYQAIARERGRDIRGVMVVRRDSPATSLEDLDGKTLAFPAPLAFAASLVNRQELVTRGIEFTPNYVGSHDSVYLWVAQGWYAGGGGIVRTLESITPAAREQLRVLWTSPPYPGHAVASAPQVDGELVERVVAAMESLDRDAAGRALLLDVNLNGFVAADDSAWDGIRQLNLDAVPLY